jgi:hypothetical protein
MPKPMYVWSGSAWVSVATEVESLAGFATQSYADNTPGLRLVVPTSVAVGSGSGSVATQGTVTFSGASSVSLNGCFTSTYRNYLIKLEVVGASTSGAPTMRLRTSGTDNSNANYQRQVFNADNATLTGGRNTNQTSFGLGSVQSTTTTYDINLWSPQLSSNTFWTTNDNFLSSTTTPIIQQAIGGFNAATQFDGISFISSGATLSGTISVYGYKAG